MKNTGVCDAALWRFVWDLSKLWRLDTQDIEGMNNMLKHICKIAPHIAWELLASRLVIRKSIGNIGQVEQEALVAECLSHHEASLQVLRNTDRFAVVVLPTEEEARVEEEMLEEGAAKEIPLIPAKVGHSKDRTDVDESSRSRWTRQ